MTNIIGFQHILVATDFSPHAEAALKQAIWISRQSGAKIVLAHVLPDLRKALISASSAARQDMFYGQGDQLQREIREESTARMRDLVAKLNADDLGIRCETLLGDPSIAIIHAVQQEKHDLVLVGTRNKSVWERFVMGSTAKRLIRNCPVPVWTVNAATDGPPKVVLAATDFSDVSRKAVQLGRRIARQTDAKFHLLHVIDSKDIPQGAIERIAPGNTLRDEIDSEAKKRMAEFVHSLDVNSDQIRTHLTWGIPSQEVARLADHLKIDLLVLGTVGRSGIKGVLLGNTAEKLLDTCDCSILTVKPDGFVSPIDPPFWPLHPDSQIKAEV